MALQELVQAVRAHATEHYSEGWDIIVEAWDDGQIIDVLREEGAGSEEDAIKAIAEYVGLYQQKVDDVMCQSGEHVKCRNCRHWTFIEYLVDGLCTYCRRR